MTKPIYYIQSPACSIFDFKTKADAEKQGNGIGSILRTQIRISRLHGNHCKSVRMIEYQGPWAPDGFATRFVASMVPEKIESIEILEPAYCTEYGEITEHTKEVRRVFKDAVEKQLLNANKPFTVEEAEFFKSNVDKLTEKPEPVPA